MNNSGSKHGCRKSPWYDVRVNPAMSHGVDGEGITLTITNDDDRELPPYGLALFNPKAGTYFIFPSDKSVPLLPAQQRIHKCLLFPTKRGFRKYTWPEIYKDRDGSDMSDDVFSQWTFRVYLEDSDKVLYQNDGYGRALAVAIRQAALAGGMKGITNDIWPAFRDAMQKTYPPEQLRKELEEMFGADKAAELYKQP